MASPTFNPTTYNPGNIPFVELYIPQVFGEVPVPLLDYKQAQGISAGSRKYQVPETERLYLLSMNHHMRFVSDGGNDISLVILDPNWDFLSSYIAQNFGTSGPKFKVRYGWRNVQQGTGGPEDTVLQYREAHFFVTELQMELHPFRGAVVTIIGKDLAYDLMQTQVSDGFVETSTVSEVIRQLALRVKMVPVVADIVTTVKGMNLIQHETMWGYIKRLLKNSMGPKGESNYICYTQRNVAGQTELHVQPANQEVEGLSLATYVFGRDRIGEMMSFNPVMNQTCLTLFGSANGAAVTINPQTKRLVRSTTTQNEDLVSAPCRSVATPIQPSVVTESPQSLETARGTAAAIRQLADSYQYQANSSVVGNPVLEPPYYVSVVVLKGGASFGDAQYMSVNDIHLFASGKWQMWEVTHQIDANNGYVTQLVLQRMSGFVGVANPKSAAPIDFEKNTLGASLGNAESLVAVQPLDNPGSDMLRSALDAAKQFLGFLGIT